METLPNRPSSRFLTSEPSSGRLFSLLEEVIEAFCGGSRGDQGSVAFLGIKLLLGVKRTGRFFKFTVVCPVPSS